MILAVDIGNTHTVLGLLDVTTSPVTVKETIQLLSEVDATSWEYAVRIREILEMIGIDLSSIEGAIISSVVPELTMVMQEAIRRLIKISPMVLGAGVKTGLDIRLDDPGTIAGDLVATAVGAKEEYPLPAFIIDMGTATTVTVVDKNGSYLGGGIMPGAGISLSALTKNTSLLPSIDFSAPKKTIGTNTVDAMKSGIVYGSAGAIDGLLDHYIEAVGSCGSIIATGGLGHLIAPWCRHEIIIDNHLLLKGLGCIWQKNTGRKKKTGSEKPHA